MPSADLITTATYPGAVGTLIYITFFIYTNLLDKFLAQLKVIADLAKNEKELISFDMGITPMISSGPVTESVTLVKTVEGWNATKEWLDEVQAKRDYIVKLYPLLDQYYAQARETYFTDHMVGWTMFK